MSTIGIAPIRLRAATLMVEADDYTASVDQAIFAPQADVRWFAGHYDESTSTPAHVGTRWVLALGFAQDWTTPGSLSTYLVEHAGKRRTVTLEIPGRSITAEVLVVPAQLGGVANQIPAAVASLPLYGNPQVR